MTHSEILREMAEPLKEKARIYAYHSAAADNAGLTNLAQLEAGIAARAAMTADALMNGAEALDRQTPNPEDVSNG